MGTLYLIATPIGNLEDITLRAVRLLGEVSLIAAEDTRHTRKLLEHYQIKTQLTSYFEHNKLQKVETILSALENGDVALVSDAGTPALNDPGFELVRAALAAGYPVSPVPGPSAPVAALVASGLPTDAFLYLGYLPRKTAERRRWLEQVTDLPYTLVFLEAPHRLLASLKDLRSVLGNRPAAITRELTKRFEEIRRGTLEEVLDYFNNQPPRGEFTLVIGGRHAELEDWDEAKLRQAVRQGLAASEAPAQLAARLTQLSGWPRRKIYELVLELKNSG
jgi:16S rRNA (cytidine1402-2'-O)-methyltransferase